MSSLGPIPFPADRRSSRSSSAANEHDERMTVGGPPGSPSPLALRVSNSPSSKRRPSRLVKVPPEFQNLDYLAEQVLKFTSLTWRSTLPAYAPVTIYYSELIADLLARLPSVGDWSPATLNTKLCFNRWFL